MLTSVPIGHYIQGQMIHREKTSRTIFFGPVVSTPLCRSCSFVVGTKHLEFEWLATPKGTASLKGLNTDVLCTARNLINNLMG